LIIIYLKEFHRQEFSLVVFFDWLGVQYKLLVVAATPPSPLYRGGMVVCIFWGGGVVSNEPLPLPMEAPPPAVMKSPD